MTAIKEVLESMQSIIGVMDEDTQYIVTHVRMGRRVPLRLMEVQGSTNRDQFELEILTRYTKVCADKGCVEPELLLEVFMFIAEEKGLKDLAVVVYKQPSTLQIIENAQLLIPFKDWASVQTPPTETEEKPKTTKFKKKHIYIYICISKQC